MTTPDALLRPSQASNSLMEQAEQEQLAQYGERYAEYRRQYRAAGSLEYEPPFPLYLMMEQTYLCNLRCPMCIQGLPDKRNLFEPGAVLMPWELYERVVLEGEQYGCPSIAMMVNDEPLYVKDLAKRIEFARDHGFMDVIMTTNGVLFTEEKVRQVIEAGVTRILFSIDAATEETYDKVRIGGDYQKVINAIDMVRDFRAKRKSVLPIIRASFVQNRLNQHETAMFYKKFSELVDYVEIQGFSSYYQDTDALIPQDVSPIDDFTCSEPWRKLIVRANGDVLPCCSFYGYEVVLGNLRDTTLYDVFNSRRVKKLRSDFKLGIYKDPACAACSKSLYEPVVTDTSS